MRYPYRYPEEPAEEKGIDVALAIDFVTMAVDDKYDVGVIFSTDTDLCPALEYVVRTCEKTVEVAAWHGVKHNRGLRVEGAGIWCHRLVKADYDTVADYRDYNMVKK